MTLKRKLTISAVGLLVCGVIVALVVKKPDPGMPFAATFVRYEDSNVLVQIENKSELKLLFGCYYRSLSMNAKGSLDPREIQEVKIGLGCAAPLRPSGDSITVLVVEDRITLEHRIQGALQRVKLAGPIQNKTWFARIDLPPLDPATNFSKSTE
jgi:hypothetical protein